MSVLVEQDADERAACTAFLVRHPEYAATTRLDTLRASEYRRLDDQAHVYLDYTGGGVYADSQVRSHVELLAREVLGNPHSLSVASSNTTRLVEQTRHAILTYFNARPGDYTAIFTPNATGALKHVGECYPFAPHGRLVLTFDNHNSVNGIREFARAKGAEVEYVPLTAPDLRIDRDRLGDALSRGEPGEANLLAFPAQSNFSGVRHPLDIIERAHARGWDVLLDAAAFVPTSRLDLREVHPDFVSVSFYKMFGYPTGVGCLLARNAVLPKLARPWFAGGTINFATVQGMLHLLAPHEAGFEDGTLNYLGIPAVETGLHHLQAVGIDTIRTRVGCLTGWLLENLLALRHGNGRHMVRVYGPTSMESRGGTIAFNLYDPDGHLLNYSRIEELANLSGISLRTGCFCNPGAGEMAEGLTEEDMRAGTTASADMTLPRFRQVLQHRGGKSAGAIRVSLGLVTNFSDVFRFVRFAAGFRDQTGLTIGEVTFDIESCRAVRDGS